MKLTRQHAVQTTQCIAHTLLQPDPSLDFAALFPNMEHLGPATEPLLTSFPLTFEFDDRIYSIERTKGVRIHEIATFVYQFLQEELSEEEKSKHNAPHAQRRIDLVGQRTIFGGLELSSLKGSQCVWLVKLVSSLDAAHTSTPPKSPPRLLAPSPITR